MLIHRYFVYCINRFARPNHRAKTSQFFLIIHVKQQSPTDNTKLAEAEQIACVLMRTCDLGGSPNRAELNCAHTACRTWHSTAPEVDARARKISGRVTRARTMTQSHARLVNFVI